jgi:hypothetical protein
MLLRVHPLMSRHGVPNWPPVWTWTDGREDKRPRGEIGILKAVFLSNVKPADRCFLYIDHEGSLYLGGLLFDDYAFCQRIAALLQFCCNRSIAEIGSMDLSSSFPTEPQLICTTNNPRSRSAKR